MRHRDLRYAEAAVSDGGPNAPALEATILSTRLGGTGEAAAADALVGTRLRHFEVKRLLGRGGMGAVYLGTDTSLDRPVALKVLAPEIAHDPEVVARFTREARAQARLRHPNVAQIYFIGEDRGLQFFALEFLEGPALDEVVAQRRAPLGRRAGLHRGGGARPAGGARPRLHSPGRQAVQPDPRPRIGDQDPRLRPGEEHSRGRRRADPQRGHHRLAAVHGARAGPGRGGGSSGGHVFAGLLPVPHADRAGPRSPARRRSGSSPCT